MDEDLGAVAPGRVADVNILGALDEPTPQLVICRGRLVARDGALVVPAPSETFAWNEHYAGATPLIPEWEREVFLLPGNAPNPFPAGRFVDAAITRESQVELSPKGPGLWPREDDALVVAATDRGGKWITRGVVRNIGDKLAAVSDNLHFKCRRLGPWTLTGGDGRSFAAAAPSWRRHRHVFDARATGVSLPCRWREFIVPAASPMRHERRGISSEPSQLAVTLILMRNTRCFS